MKSSFENLPLPGGARFAFVPADRVAAERARSTDASIATPLGDAAGRSPESEPAPVPVPDAPQSPLGEENRKAVEALRQAAVEVRASEDERARAWVSGALEIGLILARRVLERELAIDPCALTPLVDRAVSLVECDEPIEVSLHPADLEILQREEEPHSFGDDALTLRADHALGRGEANVSSGSSRVEVQLETLLAALREECVAGWEEPA